jgi:plastocyanin
VISLVGVEKGKAFKKKSARLIQRQCMFVPHVALIPVGKRFKLVNEDKLLHNLRTLSKENVALNIAHPKFKKTLRIKKKFKKPEIMRIKCDIHSWMDGWIIAIAHPYYVVSKKSGRFTLKNVPPGAYKLRAWHEILGEQVQTVTVPAGGEVKADFTFKK